AAYDIERESLPDIPTAAPDEIAPFEKWVAKKFEGPGALLQGSFVALAAGEAVGYAGLRAADAEAGRADHLMTAVRRAWRGRGVASALKQTQIEWARRAGFELLVAHNDADNAAMRGINSRLGYRPRNVEIDVRGPLAPQGAQSAPR
ncbi:MAG: GNAT family N-acetyltransferase, partial [Gaiellaceae bacterium]